MKNNCFEVEKKQLFSEISKKDLDYYKKLVSSLNHISLNQDNQKLKCEVIYNGNKR